MGFSVDKLEIQNKLIQSGKDYIESDIKIAAPILLLDTLGLPDPIIIIDGNYYGKNKSLNLNQLVTPDKIESLNVLKGEAAIAKYGEKAKDGVIEIKTKKVANPETLLDKIFTKEPKPLIIIDGKESDKLESVPPEDIESISVLKGATATELYGSKALGGAIVITTKGTSGGLKVNAKTANGVEITADEITVDGVKITSVENNSSVTDKNTPIEVRVRGYGQRPIFEKVEQEAEFPGGVSAWRRYLERNLNAQVPSDKGAPVGQYTVELQFIVHLDGSLSDIKALTKHGYGMEEEALRAIKKGPKWVPARQNGQAVVSYRKQAITFVIADQ
jgi:TonB-dependent SusC/RagA subfamily outer membrane receptor